MDTRVNGLNYPSAAIHFETEWLYLYGGTCLLVLAGHGRTRQCQRWNIKLLNNKHLFVFVSIKQQIIKKKKKNPAHTANISVRLSAF